MGAKKPALATAAANAAAAPTKATTTTTTTGKAAAAAAAAVAAAAAATAKTAAKEAAVAKETSALAKLFDEAQTSASTHRKGAHAMKKLQTTMSTASFNAEFVAMLNKILAVKKRDPVVDRCVAFVVACTQLLQENDTPDASGLGFTEFLLTYLLQGTDARDKNVRFRVTQLIAAIMAHMQEVGDDTWQAIRTKLIECSYDKEAIVRVQAVHALAKLQGTEEVEEGEQDPIVARLLELLRHDPSADVRRAVVTNIEISPATLPAVIERCLDVDMSMRRYVFRKVLPTVEFDMLTIEDRERLLQAGLRDRDESVKAACLQLMCNHWIKGCNDNIIEFLGRLDVIQSPDLSERVLHAFFVAFKGFQFSSDETVWKHPTPESALFLRVYCEYCAEHKMADKLDKTMPEISRLCVYLQDAHNALTETKDDAEIIAGEFTLLQLLLVAKAADFADEVGRRRLLTLLREFLLSTFITDTILPAVMDLVRLVASNERDFIRIVAEIIADRRDPAENVARQQRREDRGDTSAQFNTSVQMNASMLDTTILPKNDDIETRLVCLSLAKAMLERTHQPLRDNAALVTMVGELILPALKAQDADVQTLAVACLGLCALLDVDLAKQQTGFFVACARQTASEELQLVALKTLFDISMTHGLGHLDDAAQPVVLPTLRTFLDSESAVLQTIAAEGFSKLFLLRATSDPTALAKLMLLYLHPESGANQSLRQCLSYTLPAFAYSSASHQRLIAQVFVPVLEQMAQVLAEAPSDDANSMTVMHVANLMADWLDSSKLIKSGSGDSDNDASAMAVLAKYVLGHIATTTSAIAKQWCQLVSKITLDKRTDPTSLNQLWLLSFAASQNIKDKTSLNLLAKFRQQASKLDRQASDAGTTEQLASLQDFLPEMSADSIAKLYEQAAATAATSATAPKRTSTRATRAKARKADSDEDAEEDEDEAETNADDDEDEEEAAADDDAGDDEDVGDDAGADGEEDEQEEAADEDDNGADELAEDEETAPASKDKKASRGKRSAARK